MYTDADIQSRMDNLRLESERGIVSRVSQLLDSEMISPYEIHVRVEPQARTRISIEIRRISLNVNLVGSTVNVERASFLMQKITEVAEIQEKRGDKVTILTNADPLTGR